MVALTEPSSESTGAPRIGILERNRTVLGRVARVVRAASRLQPVAAESEPAGLRAALGDDAQLLLCDAADLDVVLEATHPHAAIVAWSHGPMAALVEHARRDPRIKGLVGWPSFQSMPRPWELALAVRRLALPATAPLAIAELFAGSPVACKLRPRSTSDRDRAVAAISRLAERAGTAERTVGRIAEVCHELVMNAMYDAPVDHYGQARYAADRRAAVELDEHEVPTVRVATDGNVLAVQVADPFGRLTREHVLDGIARGQGAAGASLGDVIDDRNGGAGLGLWRIYAAAAATLVDVTLGHTTSVTAVFDIDVSPREARTLPPSLHLFV